MKYEDLKCEFCDGVGEKEVNDEGMDYPVECVFCKGSGIDEDQLKSLFFERTGFVSSNEK